MEVKPGYRRTEVGVIPEGWSIRRLSEFAELLSSKRIFESDYVSMGVSFYRGTEITLLIENQRLSEEYFISEARYGQIQRKYVSVRRTLHRRIGFADGKARWRTHLEGFAAADAQR